MASKWTGFVAGRYYRWVGTDSSSVWLLAARQAAPHVFTGLPVFCIRGHGDYAIFAIPGWPIESLLQYEYHWGCHSGGSAGANFVEVKIANVSWIKAKWVNE